MILYHGSNVEVSFPQVNFSRKKLDFGMGFYTTPYYEQAKSWSKRFVSNKKNGIISKYELNEAMYNECSVLRFENYDEAWLSFIISCRSGKCEVTNYDVIEGGVANDSVFNTVELFLSHLISKDEVIKRLKYEKPNRQVCFKQQSVIDRYLTFIGIEIIGANDI